MSARIKELETALADANNAGSSLSHSHHRDSDERRLEDDSEGSGDQWEPMYPNELAGDVSDLVGTMSVGLDGQRRGIGETTKANVSDLAQGVDKRYAGLDFVTPHIDTICGILLSLSLSRKYLRLISTLLSGSRCRHSRIATNGHCAPFQRLSVRHPEHTTYNSALLELYSIT